MTEKTERAKDQARAQLESIMEMVAALECDFDRLEELKETLEGLTSLEDAKTANLEEDWEELQELIKAAGDCEDREQAGTRIQEDPLSIEVRSGWHTPGSDDDGPEEFQILLCTGGPAVRIVGTLTGYSEPDTARLEYQDWFTPWEDYALTSDEEEAVLTYCRQFYFGE